MDDRIKRLNIEYALIQIFYWMGFCICIRFASVFLQGRGYSNTALGIVLALGNAAGFILSPLLAQFVDQGKRLNVFSCLQMLIIVEIMILALFFLVPDKCLLLSLLYCLYIACNSCVNAMNTQLSFELDDRSGEIKYGTARGLGCIGFSVMSVLLGQGTKCVGPDFIPYVGLVVLLLQLLLLLFVQRQRPQNKEKEAISAIPTGTAQSTTEFIRSNRMFCILLVGIALLYVTHNLSSSFLINIVRNVDGDEAVMGTLSAYMSILELPIMVLYSRLNRKIPCSTLLQTSAVMFVVKSLLLAFAPSVAWIFVAQSLQGVSFALLTPAIVQFTSLSVPPEDSAKGQALAFAMSNLGSAIACSFGGMLYDSTSVSVTLLIGSVICALGAAICTIVIKRAEKMACLYG